MRLKNLLDEADFFYIKKLIQTQLQSADQIDLVFSGKYAEQNRKKIEEYVNRFSEEDYNDYITQKINKINVEQIKFNCAKDIQENKPNKYILSIKKKNA